LLGIVFEFFQIFSGFFGQIQRVLDRFCSSLFDSVRIATNGFGGLPPGARWSAGDCGQTWSRRGA